ncbi:30S ribosome-binding factor RbfA [Alloalcanivorax profundimaris]|jgi:ribosome-binding factor A|uniref:Ribosome-binding factor A n=1 Tax=Alloalcanivorax profundimaris TaxID=2735259 RepID=A0ABS0ANW4_9GAMM|nr:30S ribosome-binding factor RbfA [Alloalcanivorax profundimaris]MAO60382.1 ribosome-binding factor A [Alcanivorax sp.]MBM1145280.1 30S ribosome-binding factor RbfA [Alcanivorax sp. ZXX171]MCQ6263369.1 30S ribosome-binding factor RbfA [Alcanivorax sp. MM125-6]UWN49366.1 Ribosome-binding factor A [Alcanivorax sp. ALC70]MAY12133.1 ribosome-binding factor A [Alcanivorax sp.]|tara:strand:- start:785 stop:1198 length:414 start_codon:yes stop_codon:yes gene_type:complete
MSRHRRPSGFQRTDRVADQIQRELSRLLQFELKDPRVGLVTVQDVTVARDLAFADVYFTLLGEGEDAGLEAERVLSGAAGFLRSALAQSLNTRTTPRLRFHYDKTPERASELSKLIDEARAEDRELRPDDDTNTDND